MHPVFWEIHRDLPRQGPGAADLTRRAFGLTGMADSAPRVLDLGCGPGAQTIELARLGASQIVAVDNHAPFIEELRTRARRAGFADRIRPQVGDMAQLAFREGSFDLVWCESAIFIVGFEAGLRAWRPLLAAAGCVAVSEAVWLRPDPPADCRAFWDAAYPAITDFAGYLERIDRAGYTPLGHFTMPTSAWWDEYYTLIEPRLPELRRKWSGDPSALEVIEESQAEIDLFRRYSDDYGYAFFVMRRNPAAD